MSSGDISGLVFTTIDGGELRLSDYAGKVLLLVNTASQCGFTGQYAGLQRLHEHYAPRGFSVVGLPCNDFGAQEPACALDIKSFTASRFSITFPLTDKVTTKGEGRHPLFTLALQRFGILGVPHWNFYKYVVGRDGRLATWFSPLTSPDSRRLARAIEKEL